MEKVIIDTNLEKFFQVGVQLPLHERQALIEFLWKNVDVFAWDACEAPGIVLWTYRTTPQRSTRETPFSMSYGAEAVIPIETGFPTLRTQSFNPNDNDKLLERSLDFIEERRESAMVQLAYYQHKLKQGYGAKVKLRPLEPRDLVLRKVLGMAKNPAWGKLGPNWKGPYRITSLAGIEAYFLEDLDEHVIPHPWNVNNLKMYYY